MLAAVESGELEVAVAALTVTAEREKHVHFTHPILSSGLGMARDSAASSWLTTQGNKQQRFDTIRDALSALANKEVQAVVSDKPISEYLVGRTSRT